MKHPLIAALAVALAAAPAVAQEQRQGSYTYTSPDGREWVVKEGQNKSPAGFPEIAFRTNCEQIVPIGQADGTTAWTLAMPDGNTKVLATYPTMDGLEARRYLSDDGLCVWGGDVVPVTYTSLLPRQQIVQPEIAIAGAGGDVQNMGANLLLVGLGGLLLTGAAGISFMLFRKSTKAPQSKGGTSPLSKFEEALFQSLEDDAK